MICPECHGRGVAKYWVEVDIDENSATLQARECICKQCNGSGEKSKTNADRIRAMSDEELVRFIEETQIAGCPTPARRCRASCKECILKWLQQPAGE